LQSFAGITRLNFKLKPPVYSKNSLVAGGMPLAPGRGVGVREILKRGIGKYPGQEERLGDRHTLGFRSNEDI